MSIRDEITAVLSSVPEVQWDRLVDTGRGFAVFGWLPRPNGVGDDFFLINFWVTDGLQRDVVTSAEGLPAEFWERLGLALDEAPECQRVEQAFPRTTSAIRLNTATKGSKQ